MLKGSRGIKEAIDGLFDGRYVLSIKKQKRTRSLPQNAFYFGNFIESQIDCFKEFWGETYTKEQIHDWNKQKFWGDERVIESTGEIVRTPSTSTNKSTVEWEEKLETIREWFRINFEWEIGYPEQQTEINY